MTSPIPGYPICHLAKYYPPTRGGIETHVQTLARAQAAMGSQVTVLCINAGPNPHQTKSATSTVIEMDGSVQVIRVGRVSSLANFDICPELPSQLWRVLKELNPIVHLHTPNPTMLVALLPFVWQASLVITHHSDIIRQRVLKYFFRPFEYWVYQQAAIICTDSPNYIQGSKFLKACKQNLSTLPLGLDYSKHITQTSQSIAFANLLQKQYGQPLWLSVGRLVYYKALHIAIAALTKVPGTLIIVGVGPLEQELKQQAQNLKVNHRIVWMGNLSNEELKGVYQAATALWFPSNQRSEGFGLVQLEAMINGCPVINADIPCSGVPWVSRHEQEGITVPINNPDALANAAMRILNEPGLRDRLSAASYQRAYHEFDHITMARRSFELYKRAFNLSPITTYVPRESQL